MERREAYATDTQHVVNLSGYVWAVQQVPGLAQMRVLDIACGTGYGAEYLALHARTVVGVDQAHAVVVRNRTRYHDQRIRFLAMDGTALGFKDETFDAVISQDTIEHIVKDRAFVAEVSRVLRPQGFLVLLTPHARERGRKPDDPFHIREYVQDELAEILARHFTAIRWYGRRQGTRLQHVERNLDSVRRWDPLGLRRIVPRRLRHWIGSAVSRARGGTVLSGLGPGDVEYVEGVHADTNLIAVCVK
jgi:ubiquinone/menaquinone biosynthesis C-methylase UbiE